MAKVSVINSTVFTTLFIIVNVVAKAQSPSRDTLFYLLNHSKTDALDRMINEEIAGPNVFYKLLCSCIKGEKMPVLRGSVNLEELVKKDIKKIEFIKLSYLLALIKDNYPDFSKKYTLYFIKPKNDGFVQQKVYLIIDGQKAD